MIIRLGEDRSFRHAYLLCGISAISKVEFLRRARVRAGTYAGELIDRLHDAIFQCSPDLAADYSKYYAIEYSTFAQYLRKRVRLPADIIRRVTRHCSKDQTVLHFHPGYSFLDEEYGTEFLKRLLEPRHTK